MSALSATHWSVVADGHVDSHRQQSSLVELCSHYLYPIFAYFRDSNLERDAAYARTTQFLGFVSQSIGKREKAGQFRQFLIDALEEFDSEPSAGTVASNDHSKAQAFERRYARETRSAMGRAKSFARRFAREMMLRALAQLRNEAKTSNRLELFEALVPHLSREPTDDERGRLLALLNMSPLTIDVALKRMRARYAEICQRELAETLSSGADIDNERTEMRSIFRPPE